MPTDLIGHLRMSCELAHDKSVSPTCLWCQAADEIERLHSLSSEAVQTFRKAGDEIIRMRELCYEAQAFIDHDKNCAVVMGRMNNCDCGYDELWRKLNV